METTRKGARLLRKQIEWGRLAILLMTVFSFINQILLWCGVQYHLILSAAMPYYLNWIAVQVNSAGFRVIATILTVLLYLAYIACWLFYAQQKEWIVATLGLYAVDTILLALLAVTVIEQPASCLLEILLHCGVLMLLGLSLSAYLTLKKLPRRRPGARPVAPRD